MITGYVKGQSLRLSQPTVASDTIDYLTAQFSFNGSDWNGAEIFAFFRLSGAEEAGTVLLNDGRITADAHLDLAAGVYDVWLVGEFFANGEVVRRITTVPAQLIVTATGPMEGEPFPEDTGSAGEQIVAQAIAAKEAAEAAQTAAEASETAAGEYAGASASSAAGAASSASAAAGSAANAGTAATSAAAAAQSANDAKEAAQESMMAAEGHAEDAEGSASLAAGQAAAAAQSADDALGSAREAEAAAERIEDKTGDLDDLITPSKDNLVDAINDAYNHGGGADLPKTTNLLKGDGAGGAVAAVPGTDYATPEQVNAKYTKPDTGIPASDLASGVIPETSEADGMDVVESVGAASTDEEIPTAKAVYDAVSPKQDKPALVTAGTVLTLADNTEYVLSDVGSLTLFYPDGRFSSWLRITTAASGAISITLPTSRYLGAAPTFSNGETWEISVKDGVVVAGKAVAS